MLLLGSAIVLLLAAALYTNSNTINDPRLIIEGGASRGLQLSNTEARTLYPLLRARADEINTPISTDPNLVAFSVEPGDTAESVAAALRAAGLIHDAQLFRQLLRFNNLDTQLVAGHYQLRRNMTMRQIGAALARGRSAQMRVTIPAGLRLEEMAQFLNDANVMDGEEFLQLARQGVVVEHPLLADRPPGQSYEGYLFPNTYLITDYATPKDLIEGMLNSMAGSLPPEAMNLAQQQGLTFHEVLTLASIIEREAVLEEERPIIASVFLNRLRANMPLQADPTVQYAMGYQRNTDRWWKTPVQLEEYQTVNSPYNTYLYPGLPPGPIANPGLNSILAVLNPAQTDYLFFVCRYPNCQGGEHVFAETYEEHLQNASQYWGQ